MKKDCHNCEYYKAHYIKGKKTFFYSFSGECFIKRKLVLCGENCEDWTEKTSVDKKKRKQEVFRAIIQAINDLSCLKQIVVEDKKNGVFENLDDIK